jgi:hypothetical protein
MTGSRPSSSEEEEEEEGEEEGGDLDLALAAGEEGPGKERGVGLGRPLFREASSDTRRGLEGSSPQAC